MQLRRLLQVGGASPLTDFSLTPDDINVSYVPNGTYAAQSVASATFGSAPRVFEWSFAGSGTPQVSISSGGATDTCNFTASGSNVVRRALYQCKCTENGGESRFLTLYIQIGFNKSTATLGGISGGDPFVDDMFLPEQF
jgi:hypothetical protein